MVSAKKKSCCCKGKAVPSKLLTIFVPPVHIFLIYCSEACCPLKRVSTLAYTLSSVDILLLHRGYFAVADAKSIRDDLVDSKYYWRCLFGPSCIKIVYGKQLVFVICFKFWCFWVCLVWYSVNQCRVGRRNYKSMFFNLYLTYVTLLGLLKVGKSCNKLSSKRDVRAQNLSLLSLMWVRSLFVCFRKSFAVLYLQCLALTWFIHRNSFTSSYHRCRCCSKFFI